ncbi:MAG: polysaccharide biosynthesis tyrosine autokinase [Rickettsiales bacterium]|nr:polysaccharide biosynthesis tyrosine autokinase [Rickettsiales bacterium]
MTELPTEFSTQEESDFESDNLISFQDIFAILHRHCKLLFFCLISGLTLSIIYLNFAAPRYTASTSILIDPRLQSALPGTQNYFGFKENLVLDSQIEVIKSNKLLGKAAERAGLYKNLKGAPSEGFFSSIKKMILPPPNANSAKTQKEISKQARFSSFRGGVVVERVGKAFVIKISYTSGNPKIAADRANLIANTYLEDELESYYEVSQRTASWLKSRLKKLREELTTAERAVENYKEENQIVKISNRISVSDRQLSELNSNLGTARAEAAQAKAQYSLIQSIIEAGDSNTVTSDSLKNGIIVKLRNEYIVLSRRANEIRRKQGANHQAYRNLSQQMGDIQAIIIDEYRRLAGGYKNAYEIAQSKTKTLEKELGIVRNNSIANQRGQIELRELERLAKSTRNLYTKMLDTFNEQAEQQSIPQVHARIINTAMEPASPSWPKKNVILLAGLLFGAGLGIALVFIREQLDRFIWKTEGLESATQRTCLGMLPKVIFDDKKLGRFAKKQKKSTAQTTESSSRPFNMAGFTELTQLLDTQTSITAEVMRNIQLATQFNKNEDRTRKGKVISFVSANPGEGKSVTSCFLAKHLALTGKKVALIDCDFRRPSLTDWFTPQAESGFYELASRLGTEAREDVLSDLSSICHKIDNQKLFFIPAKGRATSITNLNLVASGQMNALVEHLQKIFDVVIIDLPPIGHIVDARVISNVVDSFVFLAHWGKTDREVIRKALERSPEVHDKTVGALLTLVDTDKATQYGYYSYDNYSER